MMKVPTVHRNVGAEGSAILGARKNCGGDYVCHKCVKHVTRGHVRGAKPARTNTL